MHMSSRRQIPGMYTASADRHRNVQKKQQTEPAGATLVPFLKIVKAPSALPVHVEPLKLSGLAVDCP